MIENTCGTCGKLIRSPDEHRGLQLKCPVCGDGFVAGVEADEEEDDAYGVSGGPAPVQQGSPKPAAKKSDGKKPAAAKKAKPAPEPEEESDVPEGKVECPTCHEHTPADRAQCAYCGDLLKR